MFRHPGIPFGLLFALSTVGLRAQSVPAASAPQPAAARDESRRVRRGDFSFVPFEGDGWQDTDSPQFAFARLKFAGSKTHTVAVHAALINIPGKFSSPEDFLARLVKAKNMDTNPSRFKGQQNEFKLAPEKGAYCVRGRSHAEDTGAPGAHGKSMLIEAVTLTCLHPDKPDTAIDLGYSERYLKGEWPPATLSENADAFVDSLAFEKPAAPPPAHKRFPTLERAIELYDANNRPEEAEPLLQRELTRCDAEGDRECLAEVHRNYGFFLRSPGVEKRKRHYLKEGFLLKGATYDGRMQASVEAFLRAEKLFVELQFFDSASNAVLNRGFTHEFAGQPQAACPAYLQSREYMRENIRRHPGVQIELPPGRTSYDDYINGFLTRLHCVEKTP